MSAFYETLTRGLAKLSHLYYHGSLYHQLDGLSLILPTSSILWRNTLFVGSMTGFTMVIVVLSMYFWSMNRQTQIRKSKSQGVKRMGDSITGVKESKQADSMILPETGPECVEDDEEEDSKIDRNHASEKIRKSNEKVQDLIEIISKIKVFSYLSDVSLKEVMGFVEYIDLPLSGMPLLNENGTSESPEILDGSLYVVIAGEVTCTCDFSQRANEEDMYQSLSKQTFVAEVGDLATSLLAMLSGLVREYQRTDQYIDVALDRIQTIDVRAVSSKDNTRLIHVSSKCFVAMLNKFPHDVYQIAQTILARTQRVTIQTLVKSLGLRVDDLQHHRHEQESKFYDECQRVGEAFANLKCGIDMKEDDDKILHDTDTDTVTHDAAVVAASQLGANTPKCIELIEQSASIVSIPPGHTVIESGTKPPHFYLILNGQLEVGSKVNSEDEKGLKSPRLLTRIPRGMPGGVSRGKSWKETASSNNPHDNPSDSSSRFHLSYLASAGDIVGQLACLSGDVSAITVRAKSNAQTPIILLQIPKDVLHSLLNERPSTLIGCLDFILSEISPVVHLLDWGIEWLHVEAGDVLARKGEHCNCLFVVLNGRLIVGNRDTNGDTSSNVGEEYGRGMCIGDSLVIAGSEWPNDLSAIRNSELAMVPLTVLEAIVRMFPNAGLHFAKVMAKRVHQNKAADKQDASSILPSYALDVATVAVVPLQPNSVSREDLAEISEVMAENLEKIAPCKLMTKSIARKILGKKVFDNRSNMFDIKMARMLGDLEENHRLVVYQTDMTYTRWTKLCLQHADCVVIIVRFDEVPKPSQVEQYLSWAHKSLHTHRVHLVILRPDIPQSPMVARTPVSDDLNDWSERRPWITGHHLVRIPLKTYVLDVHRMCRRITGCSLGLVFGGGGARGIAHLGVIKALAEAGITVDMVGGTSQGAFIGALYAKTPDPDDFDKLMAISRHMADGMASMQEKLLDLTFPLVSYFNGSRFNKNIIECLGEKTRIQDLVLTFFCISTDVNKSSQRVHTKGTCWKYVRASMSLHGYLPPVCEGSTLLVDGGYTNLIPGDVMSMQMGARTVIAVDVSPENTVEYYDYGSNLSGLWLLWNSWNPFVKTVCVPSMGDLSQKLMWVSAMRHLTTANKSVDLFLTPPVHEYGTLEFDKFDEIFEKSYEYAKPMIKEFLKEKPWLAS